MASPGGSLPASGFSSSQPTATMRRPATQPLIPGNGAWVSVTSPTAVSAPPGSSPGAVGLPPGSMYQAANGAATVNGWGFAGMPYGGSVPNKESASQTAAVFVADGGKADGSMGYAFEKAPPPLKTMAFYQGVVDSSAEKFHTGFSEDFGPHASKSLPELPDGMLKSFPAAFLQFTLAIFSLPILLVLYVGEDMNTKQWLPNISRWVLLLPLVYTMTLFAHISNGRPSRLFVTLSLAGSCLGLLVISNCILLDAYEKVPMLAATGDCLSWGEKHRLQEQWESAHTYHATCMKSTSKKDKMALVARGNGYTIQDCPNYVEDSGNHPDWAYLEKLEVTQQCAGWCTSGPALWTTGHVQDACSPVVAQVIHDKIIWPLKQVCLYALFALLGSSVLLIGVPRVFHKYGLDW